MFDKKADTVFQKVELIDQMTCLAVKLNDLNVDIKPLAKVIVSLTDQLGEDISGKDGLYPPSAE